MAVYDRWHKTHPHPEHPDPEQRDRPCKCGRGKNKLYPTRDHGDGKRWQVRWRDGAGKQPKRNFAERHGDNPDLHAEAFDAKVTAEVNAGSYIDPAAGKTTFRVYAEEIITDRTLDYGSRTQMRDRLGKHVYPVIGDKELRALAKRPSLIQSVVARMEKAKLDPGTIQVVMAHVSLVFSCAIDDELVAKNPMRSKTVRLPTKQKKKVVPWTAENVAAMRAELPEQLAAMVDVGAGLGLRQGEILGLSPDDIDWLRGIVKVERQVKVLRGGMVFALPKYRKTREIPLPESVKLALSEHMRRDRFPPSEVTLPWDEPKSDDERTVRLFFPLRPGRVMRPGRVQYVWRGALERVGIVAPPKKGEKRKPAREHGMHALRHFFASALLTEGEAVQAVSEWMGHHSPMVTLTIYAHLMPKSEARMRTLIDAALAVPGDGQSALEVPVESG